MQRIVLFALCLGLAAPALAQDLVGDAWGLADPADAERAAWAGYRFKTDETGGIHPPEVPNDILLFVGQKSLVAGQDIGQAAALVLDRFGNLVMDDTEVTFTLDQRQLLGLTAFGIADHVIEGTRAGHYHAGAATDFVQSNRAEYDIIPHLLSVVPRLAPDNGSAKVEAFHDFETQPLADRFGNSVLGGTSASFILRADDGSVTFLPGQVVGDAGSARLLARDMGQKDALSGQLSALVGTSLADPVPYVIWPIRASGVLGIEMATVPDLGLARMTIGPFLTDAGHYLNDGAPIVAKGVLNNGSTLRQDAWVQDGRVVIDWLLPNDTTLVSVTVDSPLGRTERAMPPINGDQP
ncbi:hypothetical protein EYC08_18825 [Tabrizicola sp. WMC-M-20]|nr:hypothetical protein EYC08_18825 [Tabrizicola sp. WMC-M-20]